MSLLALARLAYADGQMAQSSRLYAAGLELAEQTGDRILLLRNLEGAAVMLAPAQPEAASRTAGAAARLREQLGATFLPNERERFERGLAPARDRLGADLFRLICSEGRLLPLDQVIAETRQLAQATVPE